MNEARDEFAAIVARKLAGLMGDAESSARGPRTSKAPAARASARKPQGRAGKGVRTRAPADHMEQIRQKVVSAMRAGEPMKKSAIMKAARLGEGEVGRVGQVLKKLKDQGTLAMKGEKGAATYTLKRGADSGE